MRVSIVTTPLEGAEKPRTEAPVAAAGPAPRGGDPSDAAPARTWRWMVIHFPCLEAVTPHGRIVVVSDRRHIPEARAKYPGLVLWHVRELGMFGELMDTHGLDLDTFVAVNRLKLRTRGWFMGIDEAKGAEPIVSGDGATDSGGRRFQHGR